MSLFAQTIQEGFLPHRDSFGYHEALLAWYEVACWLAMVAWMMNTFIALKIQRRISAVTWAMVRPLCFLVIGLVVSSVIRWALNGIVLHVPWYGTQTCVYLVDAHLGIGISTLGFWYLIRKENNIFDRMARHKLNSERWITVTNSMRLTGIIEFDSGSHILFANPVAHRIFGYKEGSNGYPGELIGEKITLLMPEHFRQNHLDAVQSFLKTGKSYTMDAAVPLEMIGLRKNGTQFPIELTLSHYKIEGASVRFVAIIRDISYRKKLEKALDAPLPGITSTI